MNFESFYIAFHDPIWVAVLTTALFFPVRQLIWVLYVRKKQKAQTTVSDDEKKVLKKVDGLGNITDITKRILETID